MQILPGLCSALTGLSGLSGMAGRPFSPAQVSGLKLWLKADALSLSNAAAVTTWTDSSGNGNDATQSNGAKKPIYYTNIWNGKPSIYFDGTKILSTPSFQSFASKRGCLFVVYQNADTTDP